jgi:15-cis-phytoene synthase
MRVMLLPGLIDMLPPAHRLALAYAPVASRPAWAALLALDARLADTVRHAREPVIGQLRLAWWRDRLGEKREAWPQGEPLLAALRVWDDGHGALVPLVDGWEELLGEAPLPAQALLAMAEGRALGFAAVAARVGAGDHAGETRRLALGWALADLAAHLGHFEERASALALATAHDWRGARLPRALRPLVVLHGLAAHAVRQDGKPAKHGGLTLLAAMRLGIIGR